MKLMHYFIIVVSFLLFSEARCQKNDTIELGGCNLKNVVKSVSDARATIWYNTQAKSYAAYASVDGSFDSQIVGLFCNLPEKYKVEGTKILFSGNFYECKEFSPLIPGQEYFYLELTSIQSVSEK